MEGDAVSATIGVLVQNLIHISRDEISLIRGLKEDTDKLKETLTTIQTSLDDAGKKSITDVQVKRWLIKLEQVAFDADNVLDELNYQRLSKEMKSIRPKRKEVPSCFPSFNQCVLRRDMAVRIRKHNTDFESFNTSATALGLVMKLADAPAAAPDAAASETDSFTVDPIFIGRNDQVSEIVEMLTTPTKEAVSILPIVGMGGLGKTTLARKVFHHEKTKTHFQQRIWVHFREHFDAVALLKKILSKVGNVEDESREGLLKKLQEALGNKTYLLVLDDVWNQDREKWTGYINSWSGISSTMGNAILITTRITEVGSIVGTLGIHHLNGLLEEECWSIIKGKALKGEDIPPGLESIGRSIAARCQGLPLAANVVGGVLRDKPHDKWLSIKENWLSTDDVEGDENNITKILKLSVHHLSSSSLKKCFAYCSIFPKGNWINVQKLIELWMAEGFLPTNVMENVGNQFFNILLQNSLLQAVNKDDYGNIIHCSMHDLVHDVAASVLIFPVNDEGSYRPRYILLENESSRIPKEQAKWMRTLIYNCRLSDLVFSDFKSLHSLTLMDYDCRELPASFRELIHLRSLDISDTYITRLPESIGELYHLQTLRTCQYLEKLPSTLKYLFNLRHLHVYEDTKLPPQLGMLTSLQTLPYFKVGDEEGHRILELGSLKHLKGKLKIDNLENVQGEEESTKAHLSRKSGIVKLVLMWDEDKIREIINDENVLKGLQPHPDVKMLEISGFRGASFPSWTLKMVVCLEGHWIQLHNLVEIRLTGCSECEEIPTLGHLPRLKSLYLSWLKNVKSIRSSFYVIDDCSSNDGVCKETVCVFPALERLDLREMENLREWKGVEIQVKVFPRLKYLVIKNCRQLINICGTKLTSLENLIIEELGELACLPDWLFHNNQSLSSLKIRDCPKLKELPDGMQTLNSLQDLRLVRCPNLKSIPNSSSSQLGFTLLRRLSIKVCPELMNFPCEMMLSVEKLEVGERIMNMTETMEWLSKMSRLTELVIEIVPQVMIITSPAAASLPNFITLTIRYHNYEHVSAGDSVSSLSKVADGILRLGSHSLRELCLNAQKAYSESLPDQIQHLTALVNLELSNFGIEELPEWFGNLSCLQKLELYGYRKLKHLASVEAMLRLTKLKHLDILDCPLLRIDCNDDSSEWTKISHVPNIFYGGRCIQYDGRRIENQVEGTVSSRRQQALKLCCSA